MVSLDECWNQTNYNNNVPWAYGDLALKCDSYWLPVIIMNLKVCDLDIRSIYTDDGAFAHLTNSPWIVVHLTLTFFIHTPISVPLLTERAPFRTPSLVARTLWKPSLVVPSQTVLGPPFYPQWRTCLVLILNIVVLL